MKTIRFTKADINKRVQPDATTTDADIFMMVRQFQELHRGRDMEVENAGEIYHWLKELREENSE